MSKAVLLRSLVQGAKLVPKPSGAAVFFGDRKQLSLRGNPRFSQRLEARSMGTEATPWWSKDTIAVVTGSNKGVGLETVRQLSKKGLTPILTARDEKRGTQAAAKLKEAGLDVPFHQLDVNDSQSVEAFAKWLEDTYGGADILINNAAVLDNNLTPETAQMTLDINYFGLKRMTDRMLPLLRPSPAGARIVNVSSELGQLQRLPSPEHRRQLEKPTRESIDAVANKFLRDVEQGSTKGWPESYTSYSVSKMAVGAFTRVVAKEVEGRPAGEKVFVNAISPGYVATDMTKHQGIKTVEQGADTPVFVALQSPGEAASGKFFASRAEIEF